MCTTRLLLLAVVPLCLDCARAQQAMVPGGGDATGNGGTVSWTLGQPAYEALGTPGGSVYQGVQQPIEWLVTAVEGHEAPSVALWPNPTNEGITLQWTAAPPGKAHYTVHSSAGMLVWQGGFAGATVNIPLAHLAAGTYTVQIFSNGERTTTLTVIKQ